MRSQKNKKSEKTISLYSKFSKKERDLLRKSSDFIFPENKPITFNDLIKFEKIKELLSPIKEKYNLTLEELLSLIKEQIFLPITIFNETLTILETVVRYLKEEKEMSLHKIAETINRDERNIWHIYQRSRKKNPRKLSIKKTDLWIPVSIFSDTRLSALESVVYHLKENYRFSYHKIALLLKRDDRTIWTVYQRARKKYGKTK